MQDTDIRSAKALEMILCGKSLFVSGKAGTGKTYLLKNKLVPELKRQKKEFAVVAPTGVAAKNAGGVTMHSLLHIPITPYLPGKRIPGLYALNTEEEKIIRRLDLMIIDEISMVRADTLDALDEILRHYRRSEKPFGGLQMVFFGDMFQLMPVTEEEEWEKLKKSYRTPYFFSSRVVENNPFKILELNKVRRQQGNDGFIQMLNRVRIGNVDELLLNQINKRVDDKFTIERHPDYLMVCALNKTAWGCNKRMLDSLPTASHVYKATKRDLFPSSEYPTDYSLELKVSAKVMFVRNDPDGQYVNGTIGEVVELGYGYVKVKVEGKSSPLTVYGVPCTFSTNLSPSIVMY